MEVKGYWSTPLGPIRVMCEPIEGYVLARRKGAMPFAIHYMDLTRNSNKHKYGPFEFLGKNPPSTHGGE